MFTGIITDIGSIISIEDSPNGKKVVIATNFEVDSLDIGASIACCGACLTVIEKSQGKFIADISNQTLSCTTLNNWQVGERINLERALKIGDELGGHFVLGHVDGIASIVNIEDEKWEIALSAKFLRFIASKGSVVLDGISLTVAEKMEDKFTLAIIPHTLVNTNLQYKKIGDKLNLEIDVLARYILG